MWIIASCGGSHFIAMQLQGTYTGLQCKVSAVVVYCGCGSLEAFSFCLCKVHKFQLYVIFATYIRQMELHCSFEAWQMACRLMCGNLVSCGNSPFSIVLRLLVQCLYLLEMYTLCSAHATVLSVHRTHCEFVLFVCLHYLFVNRVLYEKLTRDVCHLHCH